MTTTDILINILVIIAMIAITLGVTFGFILLKKYLNKFNIEKVLDTMAIVENIVKQAVNTTNQTYVNELKASGKFDVNAHKEAFNKTKEIVTTTINEKTKSIITNAIGNFDTYIDSLIEYIVKISK